MSVKEMNIGAPQSTRRLSMEDSRSVEHDPMAFVSPPRSLAKQKSKMSVCSMQHPTSPSVPPPSTINLSPSVSREGPASPKSQDARSSSSSTPQSLDPVDNFAKRLRGRGSRLFKRQRIKTSSSSLRTLYWVTDSQVGLNQSFEQWASQHRVSQHYRMHSTGNIGLRPQISGPYNFQHLTHTKANHFSRLDEASHNELASEFSAIRASQSPTNELQGIRAESLQKLNSSSAGRPGKPACLESGTVKATPPKRPRRPQPHQLHLSPTRMGSPLSPRSIESFCQPTPKSYTSVPIPNIPPLRISAKKSTADAAIVRHNSFFSPPLQLGPTEMPIEAFTGDISASPTAYMSIERDDISFDYTHTPHAVSTPDETALTVPKPLSFGSSRTELPKVLEEDEAALSRKEITLLGAETVEVKSSCSLKSGSVRWSSASSQASAASLMCPLREEVSFTEIKISRVDQLLDDAFPRSTRSRLSCRLSAALKEIDHSWEDDIDYCYEHAAEADCDFEWDRLSVQNGRSSLEGVMAGSNLGVAREVGRYSKILMSGVPVTSSAPLPINHSLSDLPSLDMSILDLDPSSRHSNKSSTVSLCCPITPSYSFSSSPCTPMPLYPSKFDGAALVHVSSSPAANAESQPGSEFSGQKFLAIDLTSESHELSGDSITNDLLGSHLEVIAKSDYQQPFFHPHSAHLAGQLKNTKVIGRPSDQCTKVPRAQGNDIYREAAAPPPSALSFAENLPSFQSCLPVRPLWSSTLARGVAHHVALQETSELGVASSQHEKPLPLTPSGSQSEKPLPSPPRFASPIHTSTSDAEIELPGDIPSVRTELNACGRLPSDIHPLPPSSIIDPAPFGFFPSVPVELSS